MVLKLYNDVLFFVVQINSCPIRKRAVKGWIKPQPSVRRFYLRIGILPSLTLYMQPLIENGKIVEKEKPLETVIDFLGTTSSAKDEIGVLLGDRTSFSTPKPMKLIKEFVRAASEKGSIILDFFAGSGTTGHAVMDLNKEDGGTRKFILITNNESDICRKVTVPRIQNAIKYFDYTETFEFIEHNRA